MANGNDFKGGSPWGSPPKGGGGNGDEGIKTRKLLRERLAPLALRSDPCKVALARVGGTMRKSSPYGMRRMPDEDAPRDVPSRRATVVDHGPPPSPLETFLIKF